MAYYRRSYRRRNYRRRKTSNTPKSSFFSYKRQYGYHKQRMKYYDSNKNIFLKPYYSYKARKEYKKMMELDYLMEGKRQEHFARTGKILK